MRIAGLRRISGGAEGRGRVVGHRDEKCRNLFFDSERAGERGSLADLQRIGVGP